MKQDIAPLCMVLDNNNSSIISVKMKGAEAKNTIAAISAIWKNFAPSQPIRYNFLDESFAHMYSDVQRMGQIFTSFAVLAIIIACLGLFALSAFMAEQRNKEISIRKVLGASVSGITAMLSTYFIRLVFLSILIATPISWWAMNKWLQDFAYRLPISGWLFVFAGVLAICIALFTVIFQAIKAAVANPVTSLRSQ
jgi:putative ABC transport system permease protein